MHFFPEKYIWVNIPLNFIYEGQIDNKLSMVQVMAPQIVREIAAMDCTKPSQKSLIAQSNPKLIITVMSQGRPSISNQQELDCLLNSLFKLIATETPTNGQCSQFSPNSSQGTPHTSPIGARCEVSFVGLCSVPVTEVMCAIWCYIGSCHKSAWLYYVYIQFEKCDSMIFWCHGVAILFVLLALCEVIHLSPADSPQKGPEMWSLDVSFDVCLNKLLMNNQVWGD